MIPHPDRNELYRRIEERADELVSRFADNVFPFVKPKYTATSDLFAGLGSRFSSGRWMEKGGGLVTYTSLLPETALREALAAGRYYGFPDNVAAPLVLVTAQVKLGRVIDLREGSIRQRLRLSLDTITNIGGQVTWLGARP